MMNFQDIYPKLKVDLEKGGFKSTIVSSRNVFELRKSIENNLNLGKINNEVYKQYKISFDNMLTQDIHWAKSIIVIAAPSPILEVIFTIDGKKQSTIIPPTYDHSIDETATTIVKSTLVPHGYQISRARLPQKLLATHSGLARYGKNNITYVEGMGSYLRLIAFYSDLPNISDNWQKPKVLDECIKCKACTKNCPSGAIDPLQFQLHAERCLTYHNESSKNFPSWVKKSWHHCLIGCMKCQHYCPVNKDFRFWKEKFAEFTDNESKLLLSGVAIEEMPSSLTTKFVDTELLEEPASLARNLKSILA
jgi:epoxyqueuosine reductase